MPLISSLENDLKAVFTLRRPEEGFAGKEYIKDGAPFLGAALSFAFSQ